jgi:hypothetical protein
MKNVHGPLDTKVLLERRLLRNYSSIDELYCLEVESRARATVATRKKNVKYVGLHLTHL